MIVGVGAGFAGGVVGTGMVEIDRDVGICGAPDVMGMIGVVCVELTYCIAF